MPRKLNLGKKEEERPYGIVDIIPGSEWETVRKPHDRVIVNYAQGVKVNFDRPSGSYSMLKMDFIKEYRPVRKGG